ncbi:MAG: hypothetical protein WC454_07565 [Phycisphaerae bacterium]|jgi:hypothetical protein
MDKKQFVEKLRKTAEILKPFIESYKAGALKWDGIAYVKTDKTKKPDPYALAWWSILCTIADLLDAQESEITEKQKEYIRHQLCGGMGSLADFRLDASDWGKQAEEANKKLDAIRRMLSKMLNS